jgi:replicative DNA helicase
MSARGIGATLERTVLGTLLLEPAGISSAAQLVAPEDFADPRHALVFEALLGLWRTNVPAIDAVSVALELERLGRLGELDGDDPQGWLAGLAAEPGIDVRLLEERCHEIGELARRRATEMALRDAIRELGSRRADLPEVIGKVRSALAEIEAQESSDVLEPLGDALEQVFAALDSGKIDPGTPTLLPPLDWAIAGGIKPTQLVTVAGATGMGKTSLATQIAINVAGWAKQHQKGAVLIFSYEMNADELGVRMVCQMADIRESFKAPHGWRHREDLEAARQAYHVIRDLPLFVITRCEDNVPAIDAVVRRYIEQHGKPSLVVVDHIGLLNAPGVRGNRTEAVGQITRGLKNMARLLEVPVLALAQLSRDVEKREDHRPQLSDLRESGTIEQDSNVVIFVYRPSYYDKNLTDEMKQALDEAGADVKLIVAKNRAGPTATLDLSWIGPRYLFQVPAEWYGRHGLPFDGGLIAAPQRGAGAGPAAATAEGPLAQLPAPSAADMPLDDYEDVVERPAVDLDEVDLLFGSSGE